MANNTDKPTAKNPKNIINNISLSLIQLNIMTSLIYLEMLPTISNLLYLLLTTIKILIFLDNQQYSHIPELRLEFQYCLHLLNATEYYHNMLKHIPQ